jgi:hypothetical protein
MKVPKELETETDIKILLQDFLFQESNFQINDNKFFKRQIEGRQQIPIFTHYKVEIEKMLFTELLVFFPSSSDFLFFSSFFLEGWKGGVQTKAKDQKSLLKITYNSHYLT